MCTTRLLTLCGRTRPDCSIGPAMNQCFCERGKQSLSTQTYKNKRHQHNEESKLWLVYCKLILISNQINVLYLLILFLAVQLLLFCFAISSHKLYFLLSNFSLFLVFLSHSFIFKKQVFSSLNIRCEFSMCGQVLEIGSKTLSQWQHSVKEVETACVSNAYKQLCRA